jgi:hypothetical protein
MSNWIISYDTYTEMSTGHGIIKYISNNPSEYYEDLVNGWLTGIVIVIENDKGLFNLEK